MTLTLVAAVLVVLYAAGAYLVARERWRYDDQAEFSTESDPMAPPAAGVGSPRYTPHPLYNNFSNQKALSVILLDFARYLESEGIVPGPIMPAVIDDYVVPWGLVSTDGVTGTPRLEYVDINGNPVPDWWIKRKRDLLDDFVRWLAQVADGSGIIVYAMLPSQVPRYLRERALAVHAPASDDYSQADFARDVNQWRKDRGIGDDSV